MTITVKDSTTTPPTFYCVTDLEMPSNGSFKSTREYHIVLTFSPTIPSPALDLLNSAVTLLRTKQGKWILIGDNWLIHEAMPE